MTLIQIPCPCNISLHLLVILNPSTTALYDSWCCGCILSEHAVFSQLLGAINCQSYTNFVTSFDTLSLLSKTISHDGNISLDLCIQNLHFPLQITFAQSMMSFFEIEKYLHLPEIHVEWFPDNWVDTVAERFVTKNKKERAWLETEGLRVGASPASLRCGPWARHIYPSLVLVQPRKTRPYITERLLMGRKESNQTNQNFRSGDL